jgi:hypothetical protein
MAVKYDPDYDPSDVERCIIFLKTGSFARMVKRTETIKDKGIEKIRFYIVPTKAMSLKLGLKEKLKEDEQKKVFDSINGYYIKDIPVSWVQWIDYDPTTLRCYAYTDWDVQSFYNPAQDKLNEVERLLRSVTSERDAHLERIASLESQQRHAAKYGNMYKKEVVNEIADEQKKMNILTQTANLPNQGGQQ